MSENKFIRHLQGKDTAKSVLEIRNQNTPTSFANMPDGTSNANDVYSDRRGDAAGVLKGTENWKLNGSTLIETSTIYGDGRDFIDDFEMGGSGLWVNATCTFTTARRFAPNTKFVLKLCGHDLDTVAAQTVGFTLIVKFGNTVITKVFSVPVQAFDFCKEFEIDFGESNSSTIKVAANSTMQVQLLCADASAQATIYNGMTVFTALQRRVDSETVSSDTLSLDEIEHDLTTHIANKDNPHEVTKAQVGLGNCDNTSDLDKPVSTATQTALDGKVNKTGGDTMSGRYILQYGSRFSFISNTNVRFDMMSSGDDNFTLIKWYNTSYTREVLFKGNASGASLFPGADSSHNLGLGSRRWQRIYVKEICGDSLGSYILTPPEKSGVIATKADVDLAANSGRMITDEGVWYAKMDPNSTVPSYAEVEGRNYADFTQVDGDNNPIIVIYTYTSGAWDNGTTVVPPAKYDGYVPVTAKIWDIADQAGQQGGRILWNHQSKEFTPYPVIISFDNQNITNSSLSYCTITYSTFAGTLAVTGGTLDGVTLTNSTFAGEATLSGVSTAPTPTASSPSNQIANKEYVEQKIALPAGILAPFAGSSAPVGWLVCDGSEKSRTEYADLFAVIGTTYGAGDGSTTFNLPDLINRFVEGETPNNIMYVDAGLPNITGTIKADTGNVSATGAFTHTATQNDPVVGNWGATTRTYDFNASRSSPIYGNSTTVQPKALRVPYIIKY